MEILKAINAVQAELTKEGISKARKNAQQGYSFRGIDDMYNVMSPLLAANAVVILPAYSDRQVTERETQKGGVLFYTTLRGDFTFRSAKDGSEVKVTTYGEAMDSGDKATNKAMSAALKYALMQTFTIPTEGDNDSENQTHEIKKVANPLSEMKQDALESLAVGERESLRRTAADVESLVEEGRPDEAVQVIEMALTQARRDDEKNGTDREMMHKLALWGILGSKARTAIKKASKTVGAH